MNKLKIGRFGVLFLALVFMLSIIPVSVSAAAASWIDIKDAVPDGAKVIATQNGKKTYDIWHYSGGFWARNISDPLRIYDSQITGNLEDLASMTNQAIEFEYALPQAVSTALAAGKKVGVCVTIPQGYDYFNTTKGKPQVKIESGKLYFQAYPKFHLVTLDLFSYRDFISGLSKYIPFVDPKYGKNGYSIFPSSGGSNLGAALGYFDPANPMQLGPAGTIHPSQIANSTGKLVGGFDVTVSGGTYNSSSIQIGVGTFSNAGAVAFFFDYQIDITYYEIDETDVAVTAIAPTLFSPEQTVGVQVTVKNPGTKEVTSPVRFSIPGITDQRKDVTLKAGETKTLTFSFLSPASGTFPMTAEINPDRTFTESDYTNNKLTVTGQVRNDTDVAVTKIEKTSYPATSVVAADVTVKNLGSNAVTTPVEFSIPGLTTQTQHVTLAAGQTQVLHFTFSTPASGTLSMTAEANKSRTFTESNYANNKLTVSATIIPAPSGSSSCSDTITWTETDSHTAYTYEWCDNHETYHSYPYTCYHTFTYETKLTSSYSISPQTLKSGYGFAVTVNNSISTRMVSNSGCSSWGNGRANTKIPTTPDKAQVKLGWTVKNTRGTQPSTVDLNLIYRTSSQSKFEPKQNAISEIGSKLIYTDVALAGTKTSPKTHQFIISITGGGVNGIPFCKEFTDRITINGNMYEDDASGHN